MGGNKTRKKAVGEKMSSLFQVEILPSDKVLIRRPIRAPRNTTTILSGKYWKPVSNIMWINKIPSAITQSTKKMDMLLLCSRSTAPLSGRSAALAVDVLAGGTGVVVVVVVVVVEVELFEVVEFVDRFASVLSVVLSFFGKTEMALDVLFSGGCLVVVVEVVVPGGGEMVEDEEFPECSTISFVELLLDSVTLFC